MTRADNVLDYLDESFYRDYRAQGHGPMIQFIWIYEHEVDLAALGRFHRNLGKGLLGRCVEHSPIPFGRSRWVAWSSPADFEVAARPRPRSELTAWTDEQAARQIDIENGPPWRLAVQPLDGGGAAVTLVVSHTVADGVGVNDAVVNAVRGTGVDIGYPAPRSRSTMQALRQDLRQVLRDLPHTGQAVVLAPLAAKEVPLRVRPSRQNDVVRRDAGGLLARRTANDRPTPDQELVPTRSGRLPSVTVLVPTGHWDECAENLGGTSNALLVGLTCRLCDILGWTDADGLVDVTFPVNERTPGDTRGNALSSASMIVAPAAATDLRGIRASVKAALIRLSTVRNRVMAPLALMTFVPEFVARRLQNVVLKSANITCSHFGDLDPAVNRPDGTDAEWFYARHARAPQMADPDLLRKAGGIFFPIASGRLGGRIYISLCYSDGDGSTTTEQLAEVARRALGDFGITDFVIA